MWGENGAENFGKTCYNICRMTIIIWLFIILVACGGGGASVGAASSTAPIDAAITSVMPAKGADQVAVGAAVSATFTSDVDPATLNTNTFKVSGPDGAISGTVSYDPATRTASFIPIAPLMPQASYTATLTSEKSGQGPVNSFSWGFNTTRDTLTRAASEKVPDSLFSLNVINLEVGAAWPTIPFKSWRNFHSAWIRLEAQQGQWTFDRLDADVTLAEQRGVELMLVLVSTPTWASARPNEDGASPAYPKGSISEARNIGDWKNYVRTVATRYKGRVKYYELWNEPDLKRFFSGTLGQLVQLNAAAYQILKEIDPTITVVSSSMTGTSYLESYFAAGGGSYADTIGYHFYVAPQAPEAMLAKMEKVRNILMKYGVNKPLWNTETGWKILNSSSNPNDELWAGTALSDSDASAYIVRSYVLSWAAGVDRLYWYAWGHNSMGLTDSDLKTPKKCAAAYAEAEKWLVNSKVVSCGKNNSGSWIVKLAKLDGHNAWVTWNPEGSVTMMLPKDWNAKQTKDAAGNTTSIGETNQVTVSPMPILIEN